MAKLMHLVRRLPPTPLCSTLYTVKSFIYEHSLFVIVTCDLAAFFALIHYIEGLEADVTCQIHYSWLVKQEKETIVL